LDVHFTVADGDWEELEERGNKEEYVPAAVRITAPAFAEQTFAKVGLRHKGQNTLHQCWDGNGVRNHGGLCQKLSFKVKFDEYDDDERLDGLKRLNLHAASLDPTKLRELLGYATYREFGVQAPRALPARVYVNDAFQGLFIAVEDPDGRFTKAHFQDGPDGNLYKEVWPRVDVSDQAFAAALETNEELADVSGMRAFAVAINDSTPENFLERMKDWTDVEALLRYIAVDRAIKNWDGITAFYSPLSPHNFYWYQDSSATPRFHLIPWDLDNTFWAFDPFTDPQSWVKAVPVPNWNVKPSSCEPRSVWAIDGGVKVTPSRCDPLLDLLARSGWEHFVSLGHELLAGPAHPSSLQEKVEAALALIAPIVSEDPTIELPAWEAAVAEFQTQLPLVSRDFQALLEQGLIDEPEPAARSE